MMATAHAPGQCRGWYDPVYTDDQCRPCHGKNTATRWHKKTRPNQSFRDFAGTPATPSALSRESAPAPVAVSLPCIHLGGIRDFARPGCDKHVYDCAVHDQCKTYDWRSTPLACCQTCHDHDDGRPRTTEVLDLLAASAGTSLIRAVCINLDRRPDRWRQFRRQCLMANVERVAAVDGKNVPRPSWWTQGPGAWGCRLSHLIVLESALADGYHERNGVVVIFEDDCLFVPGFMSKAKRFIQALPNDWQQVYFGGQHLGRQLPQRVNANVLRPHMVNRAHAYAVRGQFIADVHRHLYDLTAHAKWGRHHIDHRMQTLHASGKYNVYTPDRWLVGQSHGTSDIGPNMTKNYFWN